MKLIPASSAAWMMLIDSSWSGLPHEPNIIAPRHSLLTETPVRPNTRCSMRCSCSDVLGSAVIDADVECGRLVWNSSLRVDPDGGHRQGRERRENSLTGSSFIKAEISTHLRACAC